MLATAAVGGSGRIWIHEAAGEGERGGQQGHGREGGGRIGKEEDARDDDERVGGGRESKEGPRRGEGGRAKRTEEGEGRVNCGRSRVGKN